MLVSYSESVMGMIHPAKRCVIWFAVVERWTKSHDTTPEVAGNSGFRHEGEGGVILARFNHLCINTK